MASRPVLIDVHTHVYTPTYLQLLRDRQEPPHVLPNKGSSGDSEDEKSGKAGRLIILPGGDEGRPVGPQYWSKAEKIKFMDVHGIDGSVISLANPWLDFLSLPEAIRAATSLNSEIDALCASPSPSHPEYTNKEFEPLVKNRFLGFGVLPLVSGTADVDAEATVKAAVDSIDQISSLPHLKGIIMGTKGLGKGLDDPRLDPVWKALDRKELTVFLHPHYGITPAKGVDSEFGERENGHVLPLALGFPMETTIAVSRLILSGVLDRFASLKFLLAHSAGALPMLSSRLASCVAHDPLVRDRLQDDVRAYLGRLYFDAVAYGPEEIGFVERCIARADGYEGRDEDLPFMERVNDRSERASDALARVAPEGRFQCVLTERPNLVQFGTDNPFFPPAEEKDEHGNPSRWRSVDENLSAIAQVPGWTDGDRARVLGENAVELFGFEMKD